MINPALARKGSLDDPTLPLISSIIEARFTSCNLLGFVERVQNYTKPFGLSSKKSRFLHNFVTADKG